MFRFTMKPSSGRNSQYLTKITNSVQCEYMEVVQTLSVLWLHSMICEACVLCTGVSFVSESVGYTTYTSTQDYTPAPQNFSHNT